MIKWGGMFSVVCCTAMLFGLAGQSEVVAAEQNATAKQFVGAWINLRERSMRADGTEYAAFGGNSKGIAMFDASGHFSIIELGDARKKFAKGRLEGTREENDGMVHGSSSFFGTYSIDEKAGTLTMHVEGSSWPNLDGTDQVRQFTLNGDALSWRSLKTTSGGTGEVAWTRAK